MGFFMPDEVAAGPRNKPKKEVQRGPVGCDSCVLKAAWPQMLTPRMPLFLPPGGARDVEILVLGETPSPEDDRAGHPFSRKSPYGELLQAHIPRQYRDRIAWQSAVRCAVPGGGPPTSLDVHACSGHLAVDIAALPNLKAILGIGSKPLSLFGPQFQIHHIHGIRFPISVAEKTIWYFPVLHPSQIIDHRKEGYNIEQSYSFPLFKNDLKRFFREHDRIAPPFIYSFDPKSVIVPTNESDARGLIERMEGPLGFDLETFQLRPYMRDAKLLTAGFSDGTTTVSFSIDHPEAPTEWGRRIVMEVAEKRELIVHSGAMELSWVWWDKGIEWFPPLFKDTMALGRVVHAREHNQSLADMSRIHLGTNIKELSNIDTKNIMQYPLAEILPYNGIDALGCMIMHEEMLTKASKVALSEYETLMRTTRSCVAMELAGLPIDIQYNKQLSVELDEKISSLQQAARNVYEVQAFERKYGKTFNIASGDHIGQALVEFGRVKLPKTGGGKQYSTDDELLEQIAATNPLAAIVQDFREASKNKSTYVDPFLPQNLPPDGLIHPQYKTTFTKTLRLSSEDPNIQNFPKHKNRHIRKQVVPDIEYFGWGPKKISAPPGKHIVVAVDSGQIQARVLGMMTKDRVLCEAIITGYDIHSDWRDRLLAIFPDYMDHVKHKSGETDHKKLMKAARGEIKSDFVFSSMFGAGAASCAARIGAPIAIMQELQGDFFGVFNTVKKWIKKQRAQYAETGEVFSPTGQRRYSMLTGNEPINHPIQSGERDIMLASQNDLCELALRTGDYYLMPRINVHDDLTFLIRDDDQLEKRIKIIAAAMTKVRFDWQILPLMVEVSIGDNWCDLEEIAKIVGNYHK